MSSQAGGSDPYRTVAECPEGKIEISSYNPDWRRQFDDEAGRIRAALGTVALSIEHVGSTAVPGLAAKPVIDIHLVVADAAREMNYAPSLESAGYKMVIREPDWFEHRMLKGETPSVNLHVFSKGCPEVDRVRLFRDWLRESAEDAALYAETKRRLAAGNWASVQSDADAKQDVIGDIMARAHVWAAGRSDRENCCESRGGRRDVRRLAG